MMGLIVETNNRIIVGLNWKSENEWIQCSEANQRFGNRKGAQDRGLTVKNCFQVSGLHIFYWGLKVSCFHCHHLKGTIGP